MSTKNSFNSILGMGALLVLVAAAGCAASGGKSTVRVTEEKQYIRLWHVQDTSQSLNLKKGDAVAMVCSKCKTVMYHDVTSSSSRFFYPPVRPGIVGPSGWQPEPVGFQDWSQRHYCPGCKSTIITTGSWLNQKETVKHTCDACGEDSVFCCAIRREELPTESMSPPK